MAQAYQCDKCGKLTLNAHSFIHFKIFGKTFGVDIHFY